MQRDELQAWLRERLESVKSIDALETPWWNPFAASIELGAVRKAYALAKEMYQDAAAFTQVGERKRDPRDGYGVDPDD